MDEKKRFAKGFLCGVLAAAVICAVVAGAGRMLENRQAASDLAREQSEDGTGLHLNEALMEEKIQKIEDVVNLYALEQPDAGEVEAGVYKGMMEGLGDDYAAYYTRDELKKMYESTSGEYRGIGAKLTQDVQTGIVTV